jgi:hypothetical protein
VEVDIQQGNFKILWLLPQVLMLFLVEKWIPRSRSETAEIGQKLPRMFRQDVIPFGILLQSNLFNMTLDSTTTSII